MVLPIACLQINVNLKGNPVGNAATPCLALRKHTSGSPFPRRRLGNRQVSDSARHAAHAVAAILARSMAAKQRANARERIKRSSSSNAWLKRMVKIEQGVVSVNTTLQKCLSFATSFGRHL